MSRTLCYIKTEQGLYRKLDDMDTRQVMVGPLEVHIRPVAKQ